MPESWRAVDINYSSIILTVLISIKKIVDTLLNVSFLQRGNMEARV